MAAGRPGSRARDRLHPLLARLGPDAVLGAMQHDINGFVFPRALPLVFECTGAAGSDLAAALASAPVTAFAAGQRLL